jgi:hypothetical protein
MPASSPMGTGMRFYNPGFEAEDFLRAVGVGYFRVHRSQAAMSLPCHMQCRSVNRAYQSIMRINQL